MNHRGLNKYLATLLLLSACEVGICQRRVAQATIAVQTSDALVFGNREWIYFLAPNSSAPRKLVKGNFPSLSPDGQRVVYSAPSNPALSAKPSGVLMLFDLSDGKNSVLLKANAWIN